MTPRAGWRPEYGWPWLLGRWAVATGAGVVLAVAVAGGGSAPPAELALDPTEIREVELDEAERAELDDLVPPGGDSTAPEEGAAGNDAEEDDAEDDDAEEERAEE